MNAQQYHLTGRVLVYPGWLVGWLVRNTGTIMYYHVLSCTINVPLMCAVLIQSLSQSASYLLYIY